MIENPYRMIRRRLKIGVRALGFSPSTVFRIEHGQYEELSDEMVGALFVAVQAAGADTDVLAAELEDRFGTPYLSEAYLRWRKAKRKSEGDTVKWPQLAEVQARQAVYESPMGAFARLVSGSTGRFSAQFCIPEATLMRFVNGDYGYIAAPGAVREALSDARYDELDELFEMQGKWIDGK